MRILLAGLLVLVVAAGAVALWPRSDNDAVSVCGPTGSTPEEIGVAAAGNATLCLLNQERTSRGLAPLAQNGLLARAARQHSEDMVRRSYFEHTSPDGVTVQDRIRATGYANGGSASTGENILWAIGKKTSPSAIVDKWMHSPPHRADILRRSFTDIGVGIALGAPNLPGQAQGQGATYTTDFGGVFDPSLGSG
jgi:uncharacterized protein YkwD